MRKKIMAVCLAFFCIISALCMDITAQAEVIHENDLEDYILEQMSAANILGVGISIVSSDKELYCAAYGAAGESEADYILGALSQSLTAAGIMQMVDDGDLSLTDTVSDYLPQYKEVSDVTIEELLHQTSGITMEQKMSDLKAEGKRGEFEFANANYNLLGEIIEEISGMSYEEYISDNILDALEMTSTYSLRQDHGADGDLLAGYQNSFGFPYALKNQYDRDEDWMQPSSGYMISDIKDMGKYLQMYLNKGGDVLSKSDIKMMLYGDVDIPDGNVKSGCLFEDEGNAKYGMGWIAKEVKGQTILYNTGMVENFTTMMVLLPEKNLGIAMMFNSMDYLVGQKLIQSLEEGVIAIELEETPPTVDSKRYLIQHGMFDAIMLFAVIIALLPVFMLGGWVKRRQKKLVYIPGLAVDVLIQFVLPTVLLVLVEGAVPVFLVKRFVPDVYYAAVVVIASLYLGGLAKVASWLVLIVMKPKNVSPQPAVDGDAEQRDSAFDDKEKDGVQENEPKPDEGEAAEEEPVGEQAEGDRQDQAEQASRETPNEEKAAENREDTGEAEETEETAAGDREDTVEIEEKAAGDGEDAGETEEKAAEGIEDTVEIEEKAVGDGGDAGETEEKAAEGIEDTGEVEEKAAEDREETEETKEKEAEDGKESGTKDMEMIDS